MPRKGLRKGQVSVKATIDTLDDRPGASNSDSDSDPSTHTSSTYVNAINRPAHQTKHLAELVYRFPSIDTSFRLLQRNDTNSTGSSLWLSSQILSSYLLHTYAKPGQQSARRRVLELGSGTGLLSLLMARLGWQVVATDIPPVLESVLRSNVDAGLYGLVAAGHAAVDQIHVCELDWNAAPEDQLDSLEEQHFDLIMTADTIYEPSLVRPLLFTIARLYRRQGGSSPTVLLALERRDPVHVSEALRIAAEECALPFKQIPTKRVRKIFDTLGDGATWSRDDWDGVEIWKL